MSWQQNANNSHSFWQSIEQNVQAVLGTYFNPEVCLVKAQDRNQNGLWQEALVMLHYGITNKRSRQNMLNLEKLMMFMIDICAKNLTTMYLKDDISYFRNLCQHHHLANLEKILKYLRNESEKVYMQLEKEYGQNELQRFFSDESSELNKVNQQDASTDGLLLMAYANLDALELKSNIMPRINFFTETSKNILDTLRSNSRLLGFYNDTARKVFKFCQKYNNKREFKKVSETLHSHFNQILKYDKLNESSGRIPYPIKLDEDQQVTQILTLRKEQLEIALSLEEWTDAHKTCNNIYELMKRSNKQKTEQQIKEIYSEFFGHLASIFWESKLYLFHSYALQNVQLLKKSMKNVASNTRREISDRFVLAALSIPLNNKISNFESLPFSYVPHSMREFDYKKISAKEDLLELSKILQVEGFPSRDAIIHYIYIENIHQSTSGSITELFNLVEREESPMKISQQGKKALETLCSDFPNFQKYKPFIAKSLSVRILQKCKSFYKNMKLSKLLKLLHFYDNQAQIEQLLFECNREGLLFTTLNYHSQSAEAFLSFNPEAQASENLALFGGKLKEVFLKVRAETTKGQSQRERFFGKAKDKIEDEIKTMQEGAQMMQKTKLDLESEDVRKGRLLEQQQKTEKARQERELTNQKLVDDQNKVRTQILEELNRQKIMRATELIQVLGGKGFKKIGKSKIVDLLANQSLIKYDYIMDFYQNIIKKEKEQIDENKKKKLKEVDMWSRSQREEEKAFIEKYANDNADQAMEEIAESIKEKQEKEQKEKEMLSTARDYFSKKKAKLMEGRNKLWDEKKQGFLITEMDKLKEQIIDSAESELRKARNIDIQRKLKEERAERDRLIAQKSSTSAGSPMKADGDPELQDWSRSAQKASAFEDSPTQKPRVDRQAPAEIEFITRSSKPREAPKPEEDRERGFDRRSKPEQEEPVGFSRGNFKSKREEEAAPKRDGPPRDGPSRDGPSRDGPTRDGPPRFNRGEKRDTDKKPEGGGAGVGDSVGFGFRSNARGRGKK